MGKYSLTCCLVSLLYFVSSCSKPEVPHVDVPEENYELTLLNGGGQADTIGNFLKDTLFFRITKGTDTIKGGYLRFETYDCDNEMHTTEYDLSMVVRHSPLDLPYQWKLNGIVGTQTLKAIFLDAQKIPKDSVTVSASAVASTKGWYLSGCFPGSNNFAVSFCQLSSGKILAALYEKGPLFYSDDEGITWHKFAPFSADYKVAKLISTPQDEIFLTVNDAGMFYSSDGGLHWEVRNTGLPVQGFWGDISYTKSGKLFALTQSGIFTSADKGVNWHQVTYGLSYYAGFSCAGSLSDGSIYAVHDRKIVVSTDGGEGWKEVYTVSIVPGADWLYVDDNDDIYISAAVNSSGKGLWVSHDHAQTWEKVFTPVLPNGASDSKVSQITKVNGVYYFYSTDRNILTRTTDFKIFETVFAPADNPVGRYSFSYIVSPHDHIVASTEFYGLHYFLP